jgi:NodT family efflux transporter outer membrane factor (OMF) lipoprotein
MQHPRNPNTVPQRGVVASLSCALALMLSACATTTAGLNSPEAGDAQVPSQFVHASAGAPGAQALLGDAWWQQLSDPALGALVDRVLSTNLSLGVSALRARQAALRADQAVADRLPTIAGRVSTQSSSLLDGGGTTRTSAASLSATWELDLWGRLAAARDAQQWEAQATLDDRRAVALSLAGSTVRLYWQLAYFDQRLASSQQGLDYARQTLKLVQAQYKAGSVSGLEMAQAQQTVSGQEAAFSALTQSRMEVREALALLLDGPTQSAQLPQAPLWPQTLLSTAVWPALNPGLPAQTLARRPDLRAAENRLRKAFATVEATRTSYYPALSLTASVGGSSESLSRVLSDPLGSLGAALTLPFLQQGEMRRNVAISQLDADAAVLGFRQSLYQALSDVDKGLSARQRLSEQARAQEARLGQARQVERLTEVRYRAGAEPLKTWLDAQESRRAAELALLDARYNLLSNGVSLIQALGGSHEAVPETAPQPVQP